MANNPHYTKQAKHGYRLHDARISYSGGGGSIRSIKYELKDGCDTKGLRDSVAAAIASDNTWLYGNINLNDYLRWRESASSDKLGREYSFLGLWVKALTLGFVMSNKTELEFKQYLGIKSSQEKLFDNIPADLQKTLDKDKWVAWFDTSARTSTKSNRTPKEQIYSKILGVFRIEYQQGSEALNVAKHFWEAGDSRNDAGFRAKLFGAKAINSSEANNAIYFACDPNMPVAAKGNDFTAQLEEVIGYWAGKTTPVLAKKFMGIGDNGNHLNNGLFIALFDTINQADQQLGIFAKQMCETFGFSQQQYQIILDRLKQLKQYASNLPKKPLFVDKWSDYRIDFNGTIESWYSNRERNRSAALAQFFGEEEIDKETGEIKVSSVGINVYIQKIQQSLPNDCHIKEGIIADVVQHISKLGNDPIKLTKTFVDELNSYYLPTLRDELNAWSQQSPNNADMLPKSWYKVLKKNVQNMPLFFGENKRLQWEQIYNIKSLIAGEAEKLSQTLNDGYKDYEITDKQVDMLAFLSNRIQADGNSFVKDRLRQIESKLGVNFANKNSKAKYCISGYERGKYTQLEIPIRIKISELIEISDLTELYELIKQRPQADNLLRDVTQLSKIVLSAKLSDSSKDVQKQIVLSHSNLQGYSAFISKRHFISRYSVQSANGTQCLLATANGLTKAKPKKGKTSIPIERYYYAFPNISDDVAGGNKIAVNKILEANTHKPDNVRRPKAAKGVAPKYASLQVFSSRYQVQFLDWFFGKHSKKQTSLEVSGAFSIAEKELNINWDGQHPTITEDGENRVYVSQPFTIIPSQKIKPADKQPNNRFLGVDIGEYGLAWCLAEATDNSVVALESGFIADKQQTKLKEAVNYWRGNQARQTFNSQDTYVARIRESLVGSYRNKLESLAMSKNARLAFEYEVSGFETGGNRVSKVYNSIKRADVQSKDNNPQNNQAWGKFGSNDWAVESVAAGTSQTCSACKKWSSLAIDDKAQYEIVEYDDNLLKTKISDGEVRFLGKKGMKAGDKILGKDLRGCIYKAMRPNDDGLGMQLVKRKYDWAKLAEDFGQGKPRGNIGIFVCPYTSCHHISDADLQAALNIAMRGYIKLREKLSNPSAAKKSGYFNKENIANFQKQVSYKPVGLDNKYR